MGEKIKISELAKIDDNFINEVAQRVRDLDTKENSHKEYLTTKQVAEALKVKRQTVARYIDSYFYPEKYPKTPRLKAVKSAKQWLIKKTDLETYLLNPENPDYDE